MSSVSDDSWAGYVRRFHDERASITDAVLGGARHGGASPYQWAVQVLGPHGTVVDPVCVGVDSSRAELPPRAIR